MTDVTVVIPAHDAAPVIGEALKSLRQQTHAPKEVCVVDDGSSDDTAAVAERHGARVLRQEQRGPGAARNRGLAAASTEWVAFLDADDWFAPNKLERQLHWLKGLGASVGCCDAWIVQENDVLRCKNAGRGLGEVLTMERLLQGNPVICSTVIARRSVLEQIGGFDEEPALIATEDYDLWLRLARREPIAYQDEPLAFYRVHGGSLSANTKFLRGVDRVMDKMALVFGDEPHFRKLVEKRRALVRVETAWELLKDRSQRQEARRLVREALRTSWSWQACRVWLRTML